MGNRWINDGYAAIPVWGGLMPLIGMGILIVGGGAWCTGLGIPLHRRSKRDAERIRRERGRGPAPQGGTDW